jgi:pyruvate formate lyase activating enzyme
MKIGGFQKTSLLDYPEKLSAIIWTMGCNYHCPFCYNVSLVNQSVTPIDEQEILSFLKQRTKQLEGVVITGGEPLLQEDILKFTKKIKDMGFLVKLDTNGSAPEVLSELLDKQLVDYVAMDIKAPQEKYPELTGIITDITAVQQSIDLLINSDVDYEFRTTIIPEALNKGDIVSIAQWIEGAKMYCLQQFKAETPLLLNSMNQKTPYSKKDILEIVEDIKPYVQFVVVRGV